MRRLHSVSPEQKFKVLDRVLFPLADNTVKKDGIATLRFKLITIFETINIQV